MRRSDFHYDLPQQLIALHPVEQRGGSRMLCLDPASDTLEDCSFRDFTGLLNPGDLVVLNDTRVIPARLYGHKQSGGRVEVLVERITGAHRLLAQVRASKSPGAGTRLNFAAGVSATVTGREDDLFQLEFNGQESALEVLEAYGHVPLPPYIRRTDEATDRERYQTVYASKPGAVAAPTAGLHFDETSLQQLAQRGVETGRVTLHVGAGTFQPVRCEDLDKHVMHYELYEVGSEVCEQIAAARRRGGRVVAVGTTVVRSLESSTTTGVPEPCRGETNLFITPGYRFRCVDALLTNFHLPESTLLMLVAAFGGYARVMAAYRHAIAQGYRFYSYGDAMFLQSRATSA
ncbi:MAG TPA: tRNA preQ1(34) S-adenosylmethionine ribosyltransferase-isomerase QueA [Gammaproteobacteria bacterium]|nr:tRNA preQ1(34) S-adenosylmethionine ribosyltransferase-isomerase QueA [Gammaproteobacteria bacterium]